MKVSVIIPVYNSYEYLKRCLDSVVNQTISDIEIICINDSSTDNSIDILNEYSVKDSRIKVIDIETNCGAAIARNIGLKIAKGEYIGFVDSDDYIALDFYEKLYNKAIQEKADISKGNISWDGFDDSAIAKMNYNIRLYGKIYFTHCWVTAIYKRRFLEKNNIKFPDAIKKAQDIVFLNQAVLRANKVCIEDEAMYYYCRRDNSLDSRKLSSEKLKFNLRAIELIVDNLNNSFNIYINENEYKYAYYFYFRLLFNLYYRVEEDENKEYLLTNLVSFYKRCKNRKALLCSLKNEFIEVADYFDSGNISGLSEALVASGSYSEFVAKNLRKRIICKIQT